LTPDMARLKEFYLKEIVPELRKQFSYKNIMQVPKLEKIVVNVGLGEALQNPKLLEKAVEQVGAITGQRPVVSKAKKSIATFKLRKGQSIGCKVTLRGERMYEFLDRLISLALPKIRDFRGVSPKAFDGRGNYSLGLSEQIIFPEINYDKVDHVHGMNVVVCTTANTDEEARALLFRLGMPFKGTKEN